MKRAAEQRAVERKHQKAARGGVWAAAWAWRGRIPKLHVVSLLLVLWGLTLAGLQVLPRAGYLTIDTAPHGHWGCAATPDNPR